MNGLYNALFGMNPDRDKLMEIVGVSSGDFYRFRDCYLNQEGNVTVHTRGGGGNREDHGDPEDEFGDNPNFLGAEDDDFDCTYLNYFFKVPEEAKSLVEGIEPSMPPAEKWELLISGLMKSNEAKP